MSADCLPQKDHANPTQSEETAQRAERVAPARVFVPRVDIVETPEALHLLADLPGVDDQGIDVTLEKNVLTLKAQVTTHAPEGATPAWTEYAIGNFERQFSFTDEIDRSAITATVKQGVLRLTLPKAKASLAQKIPVLAN